MFDIAVIVTLIILFVIIFGLSIYHISVVDKMESKMFALVTRLSRLEEAGGEKLDKVYERHGHNNLLDVMRRGYGTGYGQFPYYERHFRRGRY